MVHPRHCTPSQSEHLSVIRATPRDQERALSSKWGAELLGAKNVSWSRSKAPGVYIGHGETALGNWAAAALQVTTSWETEGLKARSPHGQLDSCHPLGLRLLSRVLSEVIAEYRNKA